MVDAAKPSLPTGFKGGSFFSGTCVKSNCFATGSYTTDTTDSGSYYPIDNALPLMARSQNGGKTWTYVLDGSHPSLPKDYKNGGLGSISCTALSCVAVGSYDSYPLAAHSKDGGETWGYVIDSTRPQLPADYNFGKLNGVSCKGLHCVAVGDYFDLGTGNITHPLLANSSDGGASWEYVIDGSFDKYPADYKLGSFSSVSCSDRLV